MSLDPKTRLTVVVLANCCLDDPSCHTRGLPLAVQRVCGVPLVRRHLQVVGAYEWRQIVIVVPSGAQQLVEGVVGDPGTLGVRANYVEACQGSFPARWPLHVNTAQLLILEGYYVIEGALLAALMTRGAEAVLCDGHPNQAVPLTVRVQDGQVAAWGEQAAQPTHAYAGAALLSCAALQRLAAHGASPWPESLAQLGPLKAVDVRREDLYVAEVRRKVEPLWQAVETPADAERCKRALVTAAQKHTVDAIAWYINRPLENALALRVAGTPITPNWVTLLTLVIAYIATLLFLTRHWLLASFVTLVVNVLDGVDGKLARAKALSSRLGQLEHSLDLLYEQSWYISFTWATFMQRKEVWVVAVGFLMLLSDTAARHVSMQFRQTMGVSLADYAPFDRTFRRFDGRRNIYTVYMLLGALTGRPSYALCAMALHALVTSMVYFLRAAKHLRSADVGTARRR
jgi:phosphatidylglycerophosphate synthase